MPRKEFTRKTKRIIIDRAGGCCERCEAVLKAGEGEVDHILPADLGGDNTPVNGQLLCRVCHRAKTKIDVKGIRKSNRKRDKATGAITPKAKIKSKGFGGRKPPKIEKHTLAPRALFEGTG